MAYLGKINDWIRSHPTEIVVLWLSKHGSTCDDGQEAYPNTSVETKQAFWKQITTLFDDILVDFSQMKINETPINTMIKSNRRVVIYASDYEEFTGESTLALDGCLIDNQLGPGVSGEISALAWERELFTNVNQIKSIDKNFQGLLLMSMATGVPIEQMVLAFTIRFLREPHNATFEIAECAKAFNLPGLKWCPETLLDIAQLENYYKQISLDETIRSAREDVVNGMGFPNAIYINAVDVDGTIRTGTQNLWGAKRGTDAAHYLTSYAYVDTLVLYNVLVGCKRFSNGSSGECKSLVDTLDSRRAKHPAVFWDQPELGRLTNWPA